jgi:hypothetical protein
MTGDDGNIVDLETFRDKKALDTCTHGTIELESTGNCFVDPAHNVFPEQVGECVECGLVMTGVFLTMYNPDSLSFIKSEDFAESSKFTPATLIEAFEQFDIDKSFKRTIIIEPS